jgi:hypothetical protein
MLNVSSSILEEKALTLECQKVKVTVIDSLSYKNKMFRALNQMSNRKTKLEILCFFKLKFFVWRIKLTLRIR